MNNLHTPQRTCIVTKSKGDKSELFRLVERNGSWYFDEKQKVQSRGIYVARSAEALQRLSKHKKIKISMEELVKMANLLKKEKKDYVNILKTMKNSQVLTFGMNMVLDEIDHLHFIVMAEDIGEKNSNKLIAKCEERGIKYVFAGTKEQLGDIFSKEEVIVVAINSKKVARGLID